MSGDSADPRVYVPADKEKVLTDLTEKGPFETRAAVLAFAASFGHKEGRREAVDKGSKDIRWGVFQEEGKSFVADLIAAAGSEDLSIMRDERGADRRRICKRRLGPSARSGDEQAARCGRCPPRGHPCRRESARHDNRRRRARKAGGEGGTRATRR
jgi:hypothetical protein